MGGACRQAGKRKVAVKAPVAATVKAGAQHSRIAALLEREGISSKLVQPRVLPRPQHQSSQPRTHWPGVSFPALDAATLPAGTVRQPPEPARERSAGALLRGGQIPGAGLQQQAPARRLHPPAPAALTDEDLFTAAAATKAAMAAAAAPQAPRKAIALSHAPNFVNSSRGYLANKSREESAAVEVRHCNRFHDHPFLNHR